MRIEVLYQDEHLLAVNKPAHLFVHPSDLDRLAGPSVLDLLREQVGQKVYPVHRLDRKTTGVLLFAMHEEALARMSLVFQERKVEKEYHAIVRGFCPPKGQMDRPLENSKGKIQEAFTEYTCLKQVALPLAYDKFDSLRLSLVCAKPQTGRMHQIRRHFAQERFYLVGDTTYGNNKVNKLVREQLGFTDMFLHASRLEFYHPYSLDLLVVNSELPSSFQSLLKGEAQPI